MYPAVRRLLPAVLAAACLLAVPFLGPGGAPDAGPSPAHAQTSSGLPPIRHVWVMTFENSSFNENPSGNNSPFQTAGWSPYLSEVLTKQGNLLSQYWATAHNSLPNYLALVSGQQPTQDTQSDGSNTSWQPPDPQVDPHGQAVGQGSTYPAKVKTLFNQLDGKGLGWKGYMEDLGNQTTRDGVSCPFNHDPTLAHTDSYVKKHDPVQWFQALTDDGPSCLAHDRSLHDLERDLQSVRTTPNFSFISPNIVHDGHEAAASGGLNHWAAVADAFLRQYVPMITSSPAFRQDGLLIVTFDESETVIGVPKGPEDDMACCNEIPGPNSPAPGVGGPGGGHIGALAMSPFVDPGSTTATPYNHFSFLRSMEDLFGIDSGGDDGDGHLGFAGTYLDYPGPGSFGSDVYNGGASGSSAAPPAPSGDPVGPRKADGSATWQHPLPAGNDLNAVSCPAADTCVAVGDEGSVVVTTDGGDHWSHADSGTLTDLEGIACRSVDACVAVGGGGAVFTTSDGGGHWSSHSSGTTKALNAVTCAGPSTCYAVGDGGTALKSTDGGAIWSSQASNTSEPLYGVSCPSATTCVAVGRAGTLRATTNGATWTAQTSTNTERLHAVSCPSTTACFAAGDSGRLMRTTDGGANWTFSFGTPPGIQGNTFAGAACPTASACVLVGKHDPTLATYGPNDSAGAAVTTTSDGGSSYAGQDPKTRNPLAGVSCPTATACFAVGERGTLLRTTNGGTSWSSQLGGPDADPSRVLCWSWKMCGFEGMAALEDAVCTDASTCLAVGTNGTVMGTTSGGSSWAVRKSGLPAPLPEPGLLDPAPPTLNAVSCATPSSCFAVADFAPEAHGGGVQATTNGGTTWSRQEPGTTADLLGIDCLGPATCIAVGSQGAIVRTTDSGGHWVAQSSGRGNLLSDVSCADSSTCVAVGRIGTVLRTTDGGTTWSAQASGTTLYLGAVDCPAVDVCFAAGSDGTVLRSGDGGQTWSAQDPGVGDELMSIGCATATHCVATGSLGAVISTADGGKSWFAQGTGTSRALRTVACPTETACLAAGDAATIMGVTPSATPSPDTGPGSGDGGPGDGGTPGGGPGAGPDLGNPGGDLVEAVRRIRATIRIKPDRAFRGKHTRTARAHRGRTRTFLARFENAGSAVDGIRLHGCRSSRGFSVRYFAGRTEITARVAKGSYVLRDLRPGARRTVAMRVKAVRHARIGAVKSCRLTGSSTAAPVRTDAVRGEVTVVGPNRPRRVIR
jgi:photosystem II stability/assembly factor-like uncharacterized protein